MQIMKAPESYPLPPEVSEPQEDAKDKELKCLQRLDGKFGVMIILMLWFTLWSALTMRDMKNIKEFLNSLPPIVPLSSANMTSEGGFPRQDTG